MCILDHTQSTFFCLWKFMQWSADDQFSFITKGSIYYVKHMYIQHLWKWIDIKRMYLLCFKFVDTAFLLCGAELLINHHTHSIRERHPSSFLVRITNYIICMTSASDHHVFKLIKVEVLLMCRISIHSKLDGNFWIWFLRQTVHL